MDIQCGGDGGGGMRFLSGVWGGVSGVAGVSCSARQHTSFSPCFFFLDGLALVYLCFDFQLPVPDWLPEGHQSKNITNDSTLVDEDETLPECVYTDFEVPQLTDRGKYQVSILIKSSLCLPFYPKHPSHSGKWPYSSIVWMVYV